MKADEPIKCPHCDGEIYLNYQSVLPSDQVVSFELSNPDTILINSELLGETLKSVSESIQKTAASIGGTVATYVKDIRIEPGKLAVEIAIADAEPPQTDGANDESEV